jgi:hypothetical protein
MLPYVIWGKTDKKLLLENAGNNKDNIIHVSRDNEWSNENA